MVGLSIDPLDKSFMLRREREDGDTASMSLTPIELLTLAEMAPTLRQKAMAMIYPANTSSAQAVVTMKVFDFELEPEVRESMMILMMRLGATGSSSVAYALPRTIADRLSEELIAKIPSLRDSPMTDH